MLKYLPLVKSNYFSPNSDSSLQSLVAIAFKIEKVISKSLLMHRKLTCLVFRSVKAMLERGKFVKKIKIRFFLSFFLV